ncbi:type II toxin-antitoxin system VapB family antitoxin [Rhizobium sp. PRIMUS64]
MTATGLATKKEAAVDRALRSLVERHRRKMRSQISQG